RALDGERRLLGDRLHIAQVFHGERLAGALRPDGDPSGEAVLPLERDEDGRAQYRQPGMVLHKLGWERLVRLKEEHVACGAQRVDQPAPRLEAHAGVGAAALAARLEIAG